MHTTTTRSFQLFSVIAILGMAPMLTSAQVLTAEEVLAPIGSSYEQVGIINNIPWDTLVGINVVWDYSWIEVDPSAPDVTTEAIPMDQAPDAALYPTADRAERTISGAANDYVVDRFYDIADGVVRELGSVGPVLSYVYDGPRMIYNLPLQYQDTVRDSYCMWSDGLGVQYHFCGHNYVSFDQVGTLILPGGTFENVKHVTSWRSSLETTEPATDSSYTVQQSWFAEGVPFPLLDVSIFISSDNGNIFASGRILADIAYNTIAERAEMDAVIFPNPASNMVALRRTTAEEAMISVFTTDGRMLFSERFPGGSTEHRMSLEHLPEATYVVRVQSGTYSTIRLVTKVN